MLYFLNALSVAMFSTFPVKLEIEEISKNDVDSLIYQCKGQVTTIINRKNVAQDLSNILNIQINIDNKRIYFSKYDTIIVVRHIAQQKETIDSENVIVPNIPNIKFYKVSIK